jgi:hypothetical protein
MDLLWGPGNAEFTSLNTLKRAPQGKGGKENMHLEHARGEKKQGEGCKRKA